MEKQTKKQRKNKEQNAEPEQQQDVQNFVGMFTALKDQYYADDTYKSSLLDRTESLSNSDLGEIAQLFQRLNKKSDATKIKSFKRLKEILQDKPESFYTSFLITWAVIYEKIVMSEHDSRMQIGVQEVMGVIIEKGKKPQMKSFEKFYAPWFQAMHDINSDAKQLAINNFLKMIPSKEKHPNILHKFQESLIKLFKQILYNPAKQLKQLNSHINDDECELIHNRNLASCIYTIKSSLQMNLKYDKAEEKQEFFDEILKLLKLSTDEDKKQTNLIVSLFNGNAKNYSLRGALTSQFCILLREKIIDSNAEEAFNTVKVFINSIDQKEFLLQKEQWQNGFIYDLFVSSEQKMAKGLYEKLEAKLYTIAESAGFGVGNSFYEMMPKVVKVFMRSNMKEIENLELKESKLTKANLALDKNFGFFKKIIDLMLKSMELEEVKFFVKQQLETIFIILENLTFDILLPTLVKYEELYNANFTKDMIIEDKELKNCEKILSEMIKKLKLNCQKVIANPLLYYLSNNNPDQRSKNVIGVNPTKYIPEMFVEFIKNIDSKYKDAIKANGEIFKSIFNNFIMLLRNMIFKTKEYANFLMCFDTLASYPKEKPQEDYEQGTIEFHILDMVEQVYQFFGSFIEDHLMHENVEEDHQEQHYGAYKNLLTLSEYLFLTKNHVNTVFNQEQGYKVCQLLIDCLISGGIGEGLKKVIVDEEIQIKYVYIIMQLIHIIFTWNEKNIHDNLDEQADFYIQVNLLYENVDKVLNDQLKINMSLIKKYPLSFSIVSFSLNSNMTENALIQLFLETEFTKDDLKEHLVKNSNVIEKNSQKNYKKLYTVLQKSENFNCTIQNLQKHFIITSTKKESLVFLPALSLSQNHCDQNDLYSSYYVQYFDNFIAQDDMLKQKLLFLPKLLKKFDESQKDKVFTSMLKSLIMAQDKLNEKKVKKIDKFIDETLSDNDMAVIVKNMILLIKSWIRGEIELPDCAFDILEYYLKKSITQDIKDESYFRGLLDLTLDEDLFSNYGRFNNFNLWKAISVIYTQLDKKLDLNLIFREIIFSKKDETMLEKKCEELHAKKFCVKYFLAAQSGIHVILNHDLKRFYYNFTSGKLNHNLIDLFEENEQEYISICLDILEKSVVSEIIFLSGINKSLKGQLADEIISDDMKKQFLSLMFDKLQVIIGNNEGLNKVDKLIMSTRINHIEVLIIDNLHKNSFKFDIIQTKMESLCKSINESVTVLKIDDTQINEASTQTWFDMLFKLNCLIQLKLNDAKKDDEEGYISNINIEDLVTSVFKILPKFLDEEQSDQDETFDSNILKNYVLSLVFKFIDYIIESNEAEKLADSIMMIEKIFEVALKNCAENELYSTTLMIRLLGFLRKVITILEMFSEEFEKTIMNSVFKIGIEKVKQFDNVKYGKNVLGSNATKQDVFSDDNYEALVVEIAETLSRFTMALNDNIKEDDQFVLLNSSVPVVQKSALYLLQSYYDNVTPKLPSEILEQDPESIKKASQTKEFFPELMVRTIEKYVDSASENQTKNKKMRKNREQSQYFIRKVSQTAEGEHIGYVLSWIILMYKLKNTKEDPAIRAEKILYQKYLNTNKGVYESFLKSLFQWIVDLDLPEKSLIKTLELVNPSELGTWLHYVDTSVGLQIHIHAFYLFSILFPQFLRDWVKQKAKNYNLLVTNVLKNNLAKCIFESQIELLELNQKEIKSDDFEIEANSNTRTIFAKYNMEENIFILEQNIPKDYPQQLINVSTNFSGSVKDLETVMQNTKLVFRRVMNDQKNSIVRGIKQFKTYLEKYFEGYEPCPICYFIMQDKKLEMPQRECNTCHKKFHDSCIQKWMVTSNKNACPMCKSPFQ